VILSKDKIKDKFKDKLFATESLFNEFCKHIEDRRIQKITVLKKVRADIINEERDGKPQSGKPLSGTLSLPRLNMTASSKGGEQTKSPRSSGENMSILERERMMLDKLERRQNKEIQKMIEYENKMEEMRTMNEMKGAKQREKMQRIEEEVLMKRRMAEEKRVRQEQERTRKTLEEEEDIKKRNAILFQQELEKIKKSHIHDGGKKEIDQTQGNGKR